MKFQIHNATPVQQQATDCFALCFGILVSVEVREMLGRVPYVSTTTHAHMCQAARCGCETVPLCNNSTQYLRRIVSEVRLVFFLDT